MLCLFSCNLDGNLVPLAAKGNLNWNKIRVRHPARTKDGDARNRAAHHGYFIAGVQARAVLAVFIDLVWQGRAIHRDAEAEVEEEVGNAGEETHRRDSVVVGLLQQGT